MTNNLGRPTTNADTLKQRCINFGVSRALNAMQTNMHYDIVAYNIHTQQVWIRKQVENKGEKAYCVNWSTFRCTCPDMVNVRKLEKECHDADMPNTQLMCKHVGLVSEVIARVLASRGDSIASYKAEMEALLVAFPGLPGNWDIDRDRPAPSAHLIDVPRETLERRRIADYDQPYHQA